jgi:branched-subunit amino acid transport protein
MNLWLVMLAAGAVTFAIRFSFIGMAGRFEAPPWFVRALRFVPAAALSALIWPDMVVSEGVFTLAEPRLVAGLVAAGVAWRTRNILLTITCGMLALWLLQWLQTAR